MLALMKTRLTSILLCAILLCGCHPNRGAPTTPQPSPVPTQLIRKINASLESSAQFLMQHQSPDGSWRSQTYGFLKDGASLTPHVALFLSRLPSKLHTAPAVENARRFLRTAGRENLIYPVYTAADITQLLPDEADTRTPWLNYLRQHQLTESLDWQIGDLEYGGWSYAVNPPRRPADLKNRGPWDFSNLSATLAAMEALRTSGITDADPAISPALLFAERCQNLPPEGYLGDEKFDDGGFFFSPAEPIRNKAGSAGKDRYGEHFNSYGSATADGILLLIDCGLPADHHRLTAARDWLARRFDVEHNPGKFVPANEDLRDASYFYYCRSLARVMHRLHWRYWQKDQEIIDGARAMIDALLKRQRPDGSWSNTFSDGREDDPLVATPMAAEALLLCLQVASVPAAPPTQPTTKPATKPTTNPTAAVLKHCSIGGNLTQCLLACRLLLALLILPGLLLIIAVVVASLFRSGKAEAPDRPQDDGPGRYRIAGASAEGQQISTIIEADSWADACRQAEDRGIDVTIVQRVIS
jgi:hypothetical protein